MQTNLIAAIESIQTGTIPTQLGMLTVFTTRLALFNASLTGPVPTRE